MALAGTIAADFSTFVGECQKAETGLAGIDASATKSASTFSTMAGQLQTADKSLAAFGIQAGPAVNVLNELGQVSGKSVTELGKLGTASAVAAAALAGWNLGRWIAELTGADAAIANLTSRVMGWGDVTAQVAANNADVLARASERAQRPITDLTEAMKINSEWGYKHAEALNTSANRVAGWEREISKAATSGALPQIVADLQSQNSTLEQLKQHYDISTEALQYLQREMRATAEATREKEAADKAAAREAQAHADAMTRLRDQMFGTSAITSAQQYMTALGGIGNLTRMNAEEQTRMNAVLGEAIASYTRAGTVGSGALNELYVKTVQMPPVVNGLGAEWSQVGEKVTITANGIIADLKRMTDETRAYEAETQRLADEWNQVKPPIDAATQSVDETTSAAQRMTVAFQQSSSAIRVTASDIIAAGKAMDDAYRSAGIFVGMPIAAGGYQQSLRQSASGDLSRAGAGQAWGNTLNVNVNNQDAQGIANKLVTEMRHQGVRF
jgi:uncharacterized protein YoxC